MVVGIIDFLNRFFLASETTRCLPEGSFSKATFRGCVGSYNIMDRGSRGGFLYYYSLLPGTLIRMLIKFEYRLSVLILSNQFVLMCH